MTVAVSQDISEFAHHPDVDALRDHDHPRKHLIRWKGVLTAKAWFGSMLGCFFTGRDGHAVRIILLFREGNDYRPGFGGEDMRNALIGCVYELDVFVPLHHQPIVDRAERVQTFT